jgi:hypothetical protein
MNFDRYSCEAALASLIKILAKGDEAAAVGTGRAGLLVVVLVAGGGALLPGFIPVIAPFPDTVAQAGKGADGGVEAFHDLFLPNSNRQAHSINESSRMTIFPSSYP